MKYTQAGADSIPQLVSMRIEYIRDDHGSLDAADEQIMRSRLPDYFERHLGRDLFAFIAEENDTVVATALLLIIEKPSNPNFISGFVGNVLNVYTLPEYRRQGISTMLMEQLIAFARQRGLDFLELSATDVGYPMYRRIGFVRHESPYTPMRLVLQDAGKRI
ncbi:MAG: GNAT family N-acetyltransferase [Ruminococcaceae bacterium]|nr:GNAT family N-acetyltransferase [Oscillospiraceae bacterium]